MKIYRTPLLLLLILFSTSMATAQKDRTKGVIWSALRGLEYEIKAGVNIGGMTPLPLPSEIRKINSYSPNLALSIGTEITKWFGTQERFAFIFGLTLESKSMRTDADVKNYGMKIIGDGGEEISGMWTGSVKTKVRNAYLTLPILMGYKISKRVSIKAGPYVSLLIERDFSGHVYEGYLREDDPTGPKVEFTDGNKATYDFSKELRKFQWGMLVGTEWKAFKHLNVYADLTWGLNNIFKSSFETITFNMYPVYLNVGFGYAF